MRLLTRLRQRNRDVWGPHMSSPLPSTQYEKITLIVLVSILVPFSMVKDPLLQPLRHPGLFPMKSQVFSML